MPSEPDLRASTRQAAADQLLALGELLAGDVQEAGLGQPGTVLGFGVTSLSL
jgi:hypothetical protein